MSQATMSSNTINVFKDSNYQDFVNRVSFKDFCKDAKKHQAMTVDEICKKWDTEKIYCETLLNVWTENWNSFYNSGGRVVNKNGRYYVLSPRNPQSRARKPEINLIL